MSSPNDPDFDPELDLVLERGIDLPRELVWAAWTRPAHVKRWFCPRPWQLVELAKEATGLLEVFELSA